MSTEAHFSGLVPSSAGARSWRQRPLRVDNDNHPGRFDGDDCHRLMVHVVAPAKGRGKLSATVPARRFAAKVACRTTVGRRRGPLRALNRVAVIGYVRLEAVACLALSGWRAELPQSHSSAEASASCAHQRSAIVVHFFGTGERDGAEGIDGAET